MKHPRIQDVWRGPAECEGCGIRDLVLFADLEKADFSLIHLPIEELGYDKGQALYHGGDPGEAVFTLREGLVKLIQYLPDGTQRIVRLLKPGATLGLEAILEQPYEHTAVALRPAEVCRIPREVVTRLNRDTPRLHSQLMKRWQQALHDADAWLTALSTGSARARIARLILQLTADDGTCALFSREDMGAMVGITTETTSRVMAELKRSGLLEELAANRFVVDRDGLSKIAGE